MPATRPINGTFLRTPWLADEPVEGTRVRDLIPRQVQVGYGTDRDGHTTLVPHTPAARDLLFGHDARAARRFFLGLKELADARAGSRLAGVSFSTGLDGFTVNRMLSLTEAGWLPGSTIEAIRGGRREAVMQDFQGIADTSQVCHAQNAGFLDLDPTMSTTALNVIRHGAREVGRDPVEHLGLVLTHEIQHSITPPPRASAGSWLEEGAAESLAWWPGKVPETLRTIGASLPNPRTPDPWTVPNASRPDMYYRSYKRSVDALLDLAGVEQWNDDGTPNPHGRAQAEQLLQGESVDQVAKNLARAIGRRHRLHPEDVDALASMIDESNGMITGIDVIRQTVTGEAPPPSRQPPHG